MIRHQKRCSRIIQSEKSLEDELPKSLVDDIVNIGIGFRRLVSRYARKSGMLDMVTLTVESGGIGGFPVSGEAFGAMIGAASVYDMANQFDLYDNGGLDICFMGALEVDQYGILMHTEVQVHLLVLVDCQYNCKDTNCCILYEL